MLYEFALHVFALGLSWIVQFIYSNLLWVFMVLALAVYLGNGKNTVKGFFSISFMLLAATDFLNVTNLVILTAAGLFLLYASRTAILVYMEKSGYSKHLALGWLLGFYIVMFFYNLWWL